MRKSLSIFAIIGALLFCMDANAQDPHFSQFYNSPLTLNPAMTGKVNGKFRVALNYRNQWFDVPLENSGFVTFAGSFDMPIQFKNKDVLGIGAVVMRDQSEGGNVSSMNFFASIAYHKSLAKNGRHSLALGVQAGYAQKGIEQEFRFFNQYSGVGGTVFNPQLPPQEPTDFTDESTGNFDMNIGLYGHSEAIKEKLHLYAGFSMFHLTEPEEMFLSVGEFKLPRRLVVHGGLQYNFVPKFGILPSVIFMKQAAAQEINVGASFGIFFSDDVAMFLGAYYRFDDSAIPYFGLEFKGFKVGFSYDVGTSDLTDGPRTVGSYEGSLIYVFKPVKLPTPNSILFNPRF